MKKYITPAVECHEIELVQILASSNPSFEVSNESADQNYGMDARENQNQNNNSNMWNNGW